MIVLCCRQTTRRCFFGLERVKLSCDCAERIQDIALEHGVSTIDLRVSFTLCFAARMKAKVPESKASSTCSRVGADR